MPLTIQHHSTTIAGVNGAPLTILHYSIRIAGFNGTPLTIQHHSTTIAGVNGTPLTILHHSTTIAGVNGTPLTILHYSIRIAGFNGTPLTIQHHTITISKLSKLANIGRQTAPIPPCCDVPHTSQPGGYPFSPKLHLAQAVSAADSLYRFVRIMSMPLLFSLALAKTGITLPLIQLMHHPLTSLPGS